MTKVVSFAYAVNCFGIPVTCRSIRAGAYEVRFMTRLYNNTGVWMTHAMTAFRVR